MSDQAWQVAGLAVTALLAVAVLVLLALTLGLRRRLALLESGAPQLPSSDVTALVETPLVDAAASLDERSTTRSPQPEYVITHVGDEVTVPAEPVTARVVPAPVFADIVARESVIQAASLVHGLRRALSPETRNRIRFHVRQEVKRSRKQRKAELREVRREWAARQRAAVPGEEPAA